MSQTIYPVLMSEKLEESHMFYKTYLGFTDTFISEWYISLSHPEGGELALIDASHDTIPVAYQSNVKGMILNMEVEDATSIYKRIQKQNEQILLMDIRDEEYGQRHFMVQDPNGLLIDIIESIPPSDAFQKNYIMEENES